MIHKGCAGLLISIHAPARGATRTATLGCDFAIYFNSRPCERGDQDYLAAEMQLDGISIHAPARGATARRQSPSARL